MDNNQQPQVISQTDPEPQPIADPATQPAPTVFGGGPTPTPPKRSHKALVFVVIAVLLILGAAAAFFLLKDDTSETSNESQNQNLSGDSVEQHPTDVASDTLEKIKQAAIALNPSHSEPSKESYVDHYTLDTEEYLIFINPSALHLNYKDNGIVLAPQLLTIMTDNGLKEEAGGTSNDSLVDVIYSNENVSCEIYANVHYARINCVPTTFIAQAKTDSQKVIEVAEAEAKVMAVSKVGGVQLTRSDDSSVKGATISVSDDYKYYFLVYQNNEWMYLAEADQATQAAEATVDCSLLLSPDYKNVFSGIQATASCER